MFFFNNLSLLLFALVFILTSVSFVSLRKYSLKLGTGTILLLVPEHAVHTFCVINLFSAGFILQNSQLLNDIA